MPTNYKEVFVKNTDAVQHWLDSLKIEASAQNHHTYIYGANSLSDYQGYMLGMSPEEIDRLIRYRVEGYRLKNLEEFQRISGISDSMLALISPRLRFDSRAKQKKSLPLIPKSNTLPRADINKATAAELMRIKGIGPVLSERIIKFRYRLQGFQINEQLYDVYGLDQDVADRVLGQFRVLEKPAIKPININEATIEELADLVYLSWATAREITRYRERHGPFENLEELTKIEDFPSDKIERIKLYLSL